MAAVHRLQSRAAKLGLGCDRWTRKSPARNVVQQLSKELHLIKIHFPQMNHCPHYHSLRWGFLLLISQFFYWWQGTSRGFKFDILLSTELNLARFPLDIPDGFSFPNLCINTSRECHSFMVNIHWIKLTNAHVRMSFLFTVHTLAGLVEPWTAAMTTKKSQVQN